MGCPTRSRHRLERYRPVEESPMAFGLWGVRVAKSPTFSPPSLRASRVRVTCCVGIVRRT
eukprot:1082224-Rhodomonas_salina.1